MAWQARVVYGKAHFYWRKETPTSNEIHFYFPFGVMAISIDREYIH